MTIALLDGDIVAYRCAASAEKDPEEIAILRTDKLVQQILEETESTEYKLFLTGSNNFRYELYPEYKANRKDKPRPIHLQKVREFLVREWNGEVTDGYEADDALGINQNEESIICSIDKDLLQVPGRHWNFVSNEERWVSVLVGHRSFYKQLILGDRSDNVPGFDGKARQSVPKFLEADYLLIDLLDSEKDMYEHVLSMYKDDAKLHLNAKLLYVLRKEGDEWRAPV